MKPKNRIKLSPQQIRKVKKWLSDEYYSDICPALGDVPYEGNYAFCKICESWFPRLKHPKLKIYEYCPCDIYSQSYVIKMAKEMIKTN